ncbi:RnfH family protein [Psychrobacter frigidicola]|uniref:UPF0125 protein ES754_08495 n=1 Tax=Psychrobacter frigidicola TaxID=45611 RepID=A0A5C7A1I1_9GAMM|nr:RnfH family protein [Psychrobacter frigidicola]
MANSHSSDCALSIGVGINRLGDAVAELITVHLAYAEEALRQHYLTLQVAAGTTLYEAIVQSGWLTQFPELAKWCEQVAHITTPAAKLWHVGVYAQKQPLSYELQALDRIEVYRSLSADPMSQRKSKSTNKVKYNQ